MNTESPVEPVSTLQNATPPQPTPLDRDPYHTAVVCGAAPLAAGALVLLLWLIKASGLFMIAALLTLWGGVIMLCIGGLCFLIFLVGSTRSRRRFGGTGGRGFSALGRCFWRTRHSVWVSWSVLSGF